MKCPKCSVNMIDVVPFAMDVFDGYGIYGCPRCKKLWIYKVENVSSTTELLSGMGGSWATSLEPYTEKYLAFPEVYGKFMQMLKRKHQGSR